MTRDEAIAQLRALGLDPHPGEAHDYKEAKLAQIIQIGCKDKRKHASEQEALKQIRSVKRDLGKMIWFEPYLCPHCGFWHISRSKTQHKYANNPGRAQRRRFK